MLTGITLENFKAFKEPQFIPIKPITLVFGPNSAGKSSILHALAFLKHVYTTRGHCDPGTVEFGWDMIHLGSWQNLVHGHRLNGVIRITLHWDELAIGWEFKKDEAGPYVASFFIEQDGKAVAKGQNSMKGGINWLIELHSSHPSWQIFKDEIWRRVLKEAEDSNSSQNFESNPPDPEILGTVDFQGELMQEIDPYAEEWLRNQPVTDGPPSEKVFSQYFDTWLGDSWIDIPPGTVFGTNALSCLFPGISNNTESEDFLSRVFNLPRMGLISQLRQDRRDDNENDNDAYL